MSNSLSSEASVIAASLIGTDFRQSSTQKFDFTVSTESSEKSIIVFGNLVLWILLCNESPNFSKEVDCYVVVFRWFAMVIIGI